MTKIVSWNVNSINSRLNNVKSYLTNVSPDVLCLQELKTITENFPKEELSSLGYNCYVYGQKAYNGVAILSKEVPKLVVNGMNSAEEFESQARVIRADFESFSVINVYVVNGKEVGCEKYYYKLDWFKELSKYISSVIEKQPNVIVVGDFNVTPDSRDAYYSFDKNTKKIITCSIDERNALSDLMSTNNLIDSFRLFNDEKGNYSWFDYRNIDSLKLNRGLRLDLCLITTPLINKCKEAKINTKERAELKPSDHVPVWVELSM